MSDKKAGKQGRRRRFVKGLSIAGIALAGLGIVGFSAGYVIDVELSSKVAQLEKSLVELRSAMSVDAIRNQAIQKTMAIVDKHNPAMPAAMKYEIASEIYNLSLRFDNLTPDLLCAVITQESGGTWDPQVVSPAGAMGLMQVMPTTGMYIAQAEGITWTSAEDVLFNPISNLRIGSRYLSDLMRYYGLEGALAAYNGGERRAVEWLESGKKDKVLYAETRRYVPAVVKLYDEYRSLKM